MATSSLNVLIAEDDLETCQFYEESVRRLGHRACATHTGRHLVELFRTLKPDLVIADIQMPDLDGVAAAEEIARIRPVPIILLSGCLNPALVLRAAQAPIHACLAKPVSEMGLSAGISQAMAHFVELQMLRQSEAQARQALEERKILERAKGTVTRRLLLDEEESYRRIRKLSSIRNQKLVDLAREILKADEVFRSLEELPESR
jgi:response regulator NasT